MDNKNYPKRLRRSESFFGLHFDFHAGDECMEIGLHTKPEIIEKIILEAKPDYIQCDCKGHRGFSSYPTKVGNAAPGVVKDALRVWREVTAKHGVALFMHYSGVWDTEALKHNPSWASLNGNGETSADITSTFGPYAEELLIPQLKELCDEYEVDGIWLDGECWAAVPDYNESVIQKFVKVTGISEVPRQPEDKYYYEFLEFCRDDFRSYLQKYTREIHKHNKEFQIASNWAFTSFMPEPVTADVDFISGDYTPQNSVNSARLEGRCMTRQGKPWDLMAWSFSFKTDSQDFCTKTHMQLKQEAAMVLSLGGGFQAYFMQKPDGSIVQWQIPLMKEIAEFCRARQEVCHKAEAVPQIGLLYSGKAFYRKNTRLFSHWNGDLIPLQGVLHSLLDSQNSVEILMEHQLTGKMEKYPLILIPEWDYLEYDFREELLAYVENGGSLLVIGARACKLFEKELSVTFEDSVQENTNFWLEHEGYLACIRSALQKVKPTENGNAKLFRCIFREQDNTGAAEVGASIAKYGKGMIAGVYFDYGQRYYNAAVPAARKFLQSLVSELFSAPVVKVTGSMFVDVMVNRIHGKLAVNLVNTAGIHGNSNVCVFDEIPPVGTLHISIRSDRKPVRIMLQPEGEELPYIMEDGFIKVELERLEIHSILVVE